ncbi:MAG: glycosyltransferase family 2 protein [Clostridiaceae bacterium]|nr:glycosyltransferase family 2 protein [Clostridiaceae bacterium]
MKVLLIIPAYNEEENILRVCRTIEEYSKEIDYIVVNDGSKDNTLKILEENNLKHINLINNLGIGGAVQTGYKYAYENNYDIAIQFDGDGQHDVRYLADICEPILNNKANMVIGTRYLDKSASEFQSTFMRRLGGNIISFFIKKCTKKKITDPTSGFRAADKKIIEEFAKEYPTEYPEPESTTCMLCKGYKITEVPVNMNERIGGQSSIRLLKTADYMIKVCLAIIIDTTNLKKKKVK